MVEFSSSFYYGDDDDDDNSNNWILGGLVGFLKVLVWSIFIVSIYLLLILFLQLYDFAHAFGSALVKKGVPPNDSSCIGIYSPNCLEVLPSDVVSIHFPASS